MGVLEDWLERRHPTAQAALETYYSSWVSGKPPVYPNEVIEAIKSHILFHATRDWPYKLLRSRALLRTLSPEHLTDEDARQAITLGREHALEVAENALRGKAKARGDASLASHVRSEIRKALRLVLRSYGVPIKLPADAWPTDPDFDHVDDGQWGPLTVRRLTPGELAAVRAARPEPSRGFRFEVWKDSPDRVLEAERQQSHQAQSDRQRAIRTGSDRGYVGTTNDRDPRHGDDIAVRPTRRADSGRDFADILAAGHSAGFVKVPQSAFRPMWADWPPEELCAQCGCPRTIIDPPEFLYRGDLADLPPELADVAQYIAMRRADAKEQPFCSQRCEGLFRGPAHSPEAIFRSMPLLPDWRKVIHDNVRAQRKAGAPHDPFVWAISKAARELDEGRRLPTDPEGMTQYVMRLQESDNGESSRRALYALAEPERAVSAEREDEVARSVLSPLFYEIWSHRNEGYGSGGRHVAELAERGVKDRDGKEISPANYRTMLRRAKQKVERALVTSDVASTADLARRVFSASIPTLSLVVVDEDEANAIAGVADEEDDFDDDEQEWPPKTA